MIILFIENIDINSMIAYPLIKGLLLKVFHKHTAHMGVVSIDDMLFEWEFVFRFLLSYRHIYEYFMQNKVYVSVSI